MGFISRKISLTNANAECARNFANFFLRSGLQIFSCVQLRPKIGQILSSYLPGKMYSKCRLIRLLIMPISSALNRPEHAWVYIVVACMPIHAPRESQFILRAKDKSSRLTFNSSFPCSSTVFMAKIECSFILFLAGLHAHQLWQGPHSTRSQQTPSGIHSVGHLRYRLKW